MKIYRAEYDDGGGPYYKLDGTPRQSSVPKQDPSDIIYGADSLEHLKSLISNYGFNIDDFNIKVYEINKYIAYNRNNGHVVFDKNEII